MKIKSYDARFILIDTGTSGLAGSLIAAITAADRWADVAPRFPDVLWSDAADRFGGTVTARALSRLAADRGPSAAFAGFNGLLTTVAPDIEAANEPASPRLKVLRQILTASVGGGNAYAARNRALQRR